MNTANKRASAIGFGLAIRLVLPIPDGTIDQADQQDVAYSYAGILATAPVVVVPPVASQGGGGRTFIAETGGFRLKKRITKRGGSITTVFVSAEGAGVKRVSAGSSVVGLQSVSLVSIGTKQISAGSLVHEPAPSAWAAGFSDDPELLLRMFAERFNIRHR